MRIEQMLALLSLLMGPTGAYAAQQYVTTPGTYGNVSVTESSGCSANNPFTYNSRTGFALTTTSTCTLTFSRPIATSSITIDIDANNTGDITTISTDGGPYTVVSGDITGPLSSGTPSGTVSASGGSINGNGSGTFRFTNSPPAAISSLTISFVSNSGTFFRVGFDDGPAPLGTPTLAVWGVIALAAGLLLMGVLRIRNLPVTTQGF